MPYAWNYVIEKESLKFKALEHVLIEKADQLFGTCSSHSLFFSPPAIQQGSTTPFGQRLRWDNPRASLLSRLKSHQGRRVEIGRL